MAQLFTAASTVLSAKGLTQSRWIQCLEMGHSVLGAVLCMFIWPGSSQWFQTVVWTGATAWWQTCRGTLCQLSLGKLIASKFTWAESELAVPGGNVLEVYKSEDTESEGPRSRARQAVTRRRLELRGNHARQQSELESSHWGQQDRTQVNITPFGGVWPFLCICLYLQWLQTL